MPLSLFRFPLFIFVMLVCGVRYLSAQTLADSTYLLNEYVVTGSFSPRTLKNTPIMTQVFTKQDIDRLNPRSVGDILQMAIPGIEIDLHGAQTRIKVQGMSADHVLFLIDGEPINSEGNGSVDLNRIDLANIQRIEVVRGSSSALYGSSAMGGVINFITRQQNKPFTTDLSLFYGSEGIWRTHALLGFKRGNFSSQTTANYTTQETYTLLKDSEFPFLVRGSNTWVLGEKLNYHSSDRRWHFTSSLSASRRTLNWDDKIKYLYDSYDLGGRIHYIPNGRHSAFVHYNASGYGRTQHFFTAQNDTHLELFDLKTHRARAQYNFGQEGQDAVLLSTGIDGVWEQVSGDRIQNEGKSFGAKALALYAQAEWKASPFLLASLGFRQDMHSEYGGHFSPRATLLFSQKDWRIRLSYSEGFRSPSTKELYMDWDHRGIFRLKGNPSLGPETSRMISLAPEIQFSNAINITLQTSYSQMYNRIFLQEEDGGRVRRYHNAQNTSELWQTQLSFRWRLSSSLRLNADYSYVRDKISVQNKNQELLPGSTVRPHGLTASLSYSHSFKRWHWNTDASIRWASALTTAVFSEKLADYQVQHYDAYTIVRLGTSFRHKFLKGTLGIDNLLNYQPRQVNISSSFSPGITFFSSLSISL